MKKIFTLMLLTMGAVCAFTACSDDDDPDNGCTCTITWWDGETETEHLTKEDIEDYEDEYGVHISKCSDLNESDDEYTVVCK